MEEKLKFKKRNIKAIAEMVIGDIGPFRYLSSKYITNFFEGCDLDFAHDGSTRWSWTADRLGELLEEPQPSPNVLPEKFMRVLRTLMDKREASDDDPDRAQALIALNAPLMREGFEAYYGDDGFLYVRHVATKTVSNISNPHRPFTPAEMQKQRELIEFLNICSEDNLIEDILLPMFRHLGFQRITAAGHKDKALEYGKDIWMRYILPTQNILYFGIQVKKGKLDSSGVSKSGSANVAEIHNQVLMMLGHEIFDPETNRRVLPEHAFIIAGGEITKQARNWIGNKLDQSRRSQIMFMDRDDIVNLFIANNISLPSGIDKKEGAGESDDIPF
jgi:hypothetical protein